MSETQPLGALMAPLNRSPEGRWRDRRVAVLRGGPSAERAVSLSTGEAIIEALRRAGHHTVIDLDPGLDLAAQLCAERVDVVFNALHGSYAEDGRLPGLLDWLGLPYTGESVATSALSFDKALARMVAVQAQIPVAEGLRCSPERARSLRSEELPLALPVMVKPTQQGSSVGISLVREAQALAPALEEAARYGEVLIERYVAGVEVAVALFGEQPIGAVEIEPAHAFYDYSAKYAAGSQTRYYAPPRLEAPALRALLRRAAEVGRAFACRSASRADFIVAAEGPIFIELNTLPGMTASSLYPKVAAQLGLSFEDLVTHILDGARHDGPAGWGG